MATISIGTLRYDIVSDTTRFVKGIKASSRQKKEADRIFREGLTPMNRHNLALRRMMDMYKKGMITKKQVLAQQKKIKLRLREEQQAVRMAGVDLKKYAGSHATVSRRTAGSTAAINANTRAIIRNRRAGGSGSGAGPVNRANIGGSLGSALGGGGAGAGMGRLAGMAAMGSMGGMLVGLVGISKMVKETALLETALTDMQVIMGDDAAGTAMVNNLREIARTTPLTSKALIKGAQTLLGYGLSAEGLEDTMYRIGEIAGGDTARMDSLTRAFAQVQSAGKLMGQEMLQLVNAGFPVAEIAKAAGVSMEDFRDAMEKGEIKASHLTEAMVNLTAAGGMMEGRLARQADTINGKWITAMGSIDQQFAESGEKYADGMKDMAQFTGEFTVEAIKGFGILAVAGGEVADVLGTVFSVITGQGTEGFSIKDRLDEDGKALSKYKLLIQATADTLQVFYTGATQEEIEATRARDRKFKMLSNAAHARSDDDEKALKGREKITQATDKEVADFKKGQKEKADAIRDEMKPEEDLAAMRMRHSKERGKARKEATRIGRSSGAGGYNEYMASVWELQEAELAKYKNTVAKEKAEADAQAKKDADTKLEKRRFDKEKELIKKVAGEKRKLIDEEQKYQAKIATAYGNRGSMASMDSYAASAAMEAEYEQNRITNSANDKRQEQLDELKDLEKTAEKKAAERHEQRMRAITNTYDNRGKP